jgi:Tfp pilus assembly protein PilO
MAASDWSERTWMLVTIGVGVVVNAALAYFLYAAHSKYAELEKKNKARQTEAAGLRVEVEKKSGLEARLKRLQRDLKKKESQLPELGDVEGLIASISERAQQSGASLLSSSKVAQPTVEANYEKTTYKTRWQADFMSWCKLLNSMEEKFPRFIAFENLVLTPTNSGAVPMGVKHEISVDVIVYRYLRQAN